jgi:adenosylhomocysteine nucleosidase
MTPGFVVGLAAEARIAARGSYLVRIGGGLPEGAARAARALLEEGADALVSFGLAGGLDPALRPGAIVVPAVVLNGGERFATDPRLRRRFAGAAGDVQCRERQSRGWRAHVPGPEPGIGAHHDGGAEASVRHDASRISGAADDAGIPWMLGSATPHILLAGAAAVATVAEKAALHRATGAHAVDLESGAVARVAADRGVPFAVIRAICDPAERPLPPAALVALDVRGGIGPLRVLGSVLRQPSQIGDLIRLARDAAAARAALVRVIEAASAAEG